MEEAAPRIERTTMTTNETTAPAETGGRCPLGFDRPRADWDPAAHEGGAPIVAELARLRQEAPVAWTDAGGGYWTVTRYADVTAAARNTAQFSNVPRHPRIGTVFTPPLEADRPVHTSFRRLLNQFFTRDYLAAHTAWLEELADAFIDRLTAQDAAADADADLAHADWVVELCMPLPATVLCRLIGMPDEDWRQIRSWTETSFLTHRDRGDDPERFAEVNASLNEYGQALIDRARREEGRDDIVAALLVDPIAEGLDDAQIFGLVRLLLQAGHSTTAMGMSNVLHRLAVDADAQRFVRDHPDRLDDVVREILRADTPVLANVRRVTEDVEFGGRQLRRDDHVLLSWGAANNDPERISDPERIDPDRPVTDSLTFGHGIHKCPGMPLAIREISVVMDRLLQRTTWFSLRGEAQRKRWEGNGVVSMGIVTER